MKIIFHLPKFLTLILVFLTSCNHDELNVMNKKLIENDITKEDKEKLHSKKECLELTATNQSYAYAINNIEKQSEVIDFKSLLEKNKKEKISLTFVLDETKYQNNKCFWSIRVEENHNTHLVFWKSFLVSADGKEVYEQDLSDDSFIKINKT